MKLVRAYCMATERFVWVNPDHVGNEYGETWGQVSQTDESGWFFLRCHLVVLDT